MKLKWTSMVRAVPLGVAVCLLLCLGMGAAQAPDQGMPPVFRGLMEARTDEERVTRQRALQINYKGEDWSLDLSEQMDFLLTPALLVQEAVSDGIILTYPEE